jgi:Pyruvate/2-oxoacid:ferredoxin oxidoreductase gamma subunit
VVRLFQPFPTDAMLAALPATVKAIAVLDRTKEPGAVGEPLYQAIVAAISERMDSDAPPFAAMPRVIGGRYGLSSKEVTPGMIRPVFDELAAARPKRHFTVGIYDDVTHLSLPIDVDYRTPRPAGEVQALFFGLGSDGTVGANHASVKIIGEGTDRFAQGYFVYDSKKSGGTTVSHLRFGPVPTRSAYLIDAADFIACHQFGLLDKIKILDFAKPGATFLLNSPYGPGEIWDHLPAEVQRLLVDKQIDFWVIDALAVAAETGMGNRINTIMQPCFFQLSGVLPEDEAIARIKEFVNKTYIKRGQAVVDRNYAAIDASIARLGHVTLGPAGTGHPLPPVVPADAPDFVKNVTAVLMAGGGDQLPVSAFPVDGTFPSGTTQFEKRAIALELPIWDLHRLWQVRDGLPARRDPDEGLPGGGRRERARRLPLQGVQVPRPVEPPPDDPGGAGRLHRLRCLRGRLPCQEQDRDQAQVDQPRTGRRAPRQGASQLGVLPVDRAARPEPDRPRHRQGLPGPRAPVRVLARLQRLRRDPVPQARLAALRRPDDRGQRHGLLIDLRRKPAHDPLVGQRPGPRPGLEQLPLRGQRRVRPGHAPGA